MWLSVQRREKTWNLVSAELVGLLVCVCFLSDAVFSTESVIPKSLLDSGLESSSSEEIGERKG